MSLASPTVLVFFGTDVNEAAFTLDDPIKGLLNNTGFTLGGDTGTDISADVMSVDIRRGRNRELDEFDAGICTIQLQNQSHDYSPIHSGAAYAGFLTPGKRVRVSMYSQTLFEGVTESWATSDDMTGEAVATMTAIDGLGQLGRMEFSEWSPTASQTAEDRLDDVLNRPEVNFGSGHSFDSGTSILQGGTVDTGANVLNYCQKVALSDFGLFFANRRNQLIFYGRQRPPEFPVAKFNDDPTQWNFSITPTGPFQSYESSDSNDRLVNRVTATNEGGTPQTVDDTDSQDIYGVRAISVDGLLLTTDELARSFAEYVLALYRDPTPRLESITVNISAMIPNGLLLPGDFARLEIGSFIQIDITGVGGDNIYEIQGVEHSIPVDGAHLMTLRVTRGDRITFILDSFTFGILDTSILGF